MIQIYIYLFIFNKLYYLPSYTDTLSQKKKRKISGLTYFGICWIHIKNIVSTGLDANIVPSIYTAKFIYLNFVLVKAGKNVFIKLRYIHLTYSRC